MLRPRLKSFLSTENIISVILILAAALLPTFMSAYKVSVYSYFYTTALMGLSIALIWGYTGIFSFGQAAFFGIGGYTYGILAKLWGNTALTPVALLIGVALAALVAAILGYFMFYGGINDVFVGLITMCFTIALATFMGQTAGSQWKIGDVALGGFNGLTKIPTLYFGDFKCDKLAFYYVTFIVLAAVYIALRVLKRTKVGYALLAICENRTRSELFGYHVKKIQVIVFTVGGAIAGLAGVVTDVIGFLVKPTGAFSPIFTLVEVAGAVIYGIFLYGLNPVKLDFSSRSAFFGGLKTNGFQVFRIFMAKFCVNLFCNVFLNTIAMVIMGYFAPEVFWVKITTRIVKNLTMLPIEVFILLLVLYPVMVAYRAAFREKRSA